LDAGVHDIQIGNANPFYVKCSSDGWMIIHRRMNGRVNFDKTWQEYVDGFGDFDGEFFIGLEKLHLITNFTRHELYVAITFEWGSRTVQYDNFRIGNSKSFYELESIGQSSGDNYINVLQWNVNQKFSTYDENHNSLSTRNCAENGNGGWWYPRNCGEM
ncbi:hypothetical protein KR093_003381, partial [Drosophila rubida]